MKNKYKTSIISKSNRNLLFMLSKINWMARKHKECNLDNTIKVKFKRTKYIKD